MKILINTILFIFISFTICAQTQSRLDILRLQGLSLMGEGRYEEAIDQFNKFVVANPRLADGYHLRGLCFEKRSQYQYSVLDLTRARRLDPTSDIIKKDLDRVTAIWNNQLYQKIDGYKRDIAKDPSYPFSYLEIGKAYRWLEEWKNSETWYDEYLKRDYKPSPDEIIRYSEVLSKTGSIVKGERLLKKFTLLYPDDWRLWSRYGYFSLWLGNYKNAESAFKSSLKIKPFFKEAEEGLDLSRRQGYLVPNKPAPPPAPEAVEYPIDRYYRLLAEEPGDDQTRFDLINELIAVNRFEEAHQQLQYLSPEHKDEEQYKKISKIVTDYRDSTFNRDVEYYTSLLKNNPTDKEAVLKLAEAYGNLYYYDNAIEILSEYLEFIPEDQDLDARFKYSQYCAWNYEWEKSLLQLNKLLLLDPDNLDYQLLRGQIGSGTGVDLDLSEKYLVNVINSRPEEIRALIALGNVCSLKNNFPEAKKYLDSAALIDPENRELEKAITAYDLRLKEYQRIQTLAFLKSEAKRLASEEKYSDSFESYEKYKNLAYEMDREEWTEYAGISTEANKYSESINAYNTLLDEEFNYDLALKLARVYYLNREPYNALNILEKLNSLDPRNSEMRLLMADTYVMLNQPDQAEPIYKGLLSEARDETVRNTLFMRLAVLGDHFVKNKNYGNANSLYEEVEETATDEEIKKTVFLKQADMSYALIHDKRFGDAEDLLYSLARRNKDEELNKEINYRKIFLGDVYALEKKYGSAATVYNDILSESNDTSSIRLARERINWLPPSSLSRGFNSVKSFFSYFLPRNLSLEPFSSYYIDNLKYRLFSYGAKLDAAFAGILSLGAYWEKTNLNNPIIDKDFIKYRGLAAIYFSKYLSVNGSYGVLNIYGEPDKKFGDAALTYLSPEQFSATFSYENNDARMVLYSPFIINNRIEINNYRLKAAYNYLDAASFTGIYNYFNLSDKNEGNDLQIRLGKKFLVNGIFGYEFYFSDYSFISAVYDSPQNYSSHCLWTEWIWNYSNYKIKADARIGYSPSVNYILSEVFGEVTYNPIGGLLLTLKLGYSNSYRFDAGYQSYFASVMAYWGVF